MAAVRVRLQLPCGFHGMEASIVYTIYSCAFDTHTMADTKVTDLDGICAKADPMVWPILLDISAMSYCWRWVTPYHLKQPVDGGLQKMAPLRRRQPKLTQYEQFTSTMNIILSGRVKILTSMIGRVA